MVIGYARKSQPVLRPHTLCKVQDLLPGDVFILDRNSYVMKEYNQEDDCVVAYSQRGQFDIELDLGKIVFKAHEWGGIYG